MSGEGKGSDSIDYLARVLLFLDKKIWRMAYFFSRNVDEAHDLAQEVRLRVIEKAEGFRRGSKPETWIYAVAINVCRDHVRGRDRRRRREFELDDEMAGASEDRDMALSLKAAIEKLSIRQRQLINLREFAGLSYKEIAEVLSISLGSVESGLFDARRRLARLLGDENGGTR